MDGGRWERLERYARFRQRRFRLDHLPDELLLHVCSHLAHEDVCAVLVALYSAPRDNVTAASQCHVVPTTLRPEWLHGAAVDGVRRALASLAEPALFHARDCSYVAAHADWSVFSGPRMPVCLCAYAWTPLRCAQVLTSDAEVVRLVRRCAHRGSTSVTLVLHRYIVCNDRTVLHPEPCARVTHHVFPHFLLSESRHAGRRWRDHDRLGAPASPRILSPARP